MMMNFDGEDTKEYKETAYWLDDSYSYSLKKLDLDMKNRPTPLAK